MLTNHLTGNKGFWLDPNEDNTYIDRTTGVQDLQVFYSRLLQYTSQVLIGDINKSGEVDLTDVILAFQISTGIPTSDIINIEADVNDDQKIGIVEAVYALQTAAEVKK